MKDRKEIPTDIYNIIDQLHKSCHYTHIAISFQDIISTTIIPDHKTGRLDKTQMAGNLTALILEIKLFRKNGFLPDQLVDGMLDSVLVELNDVVP